MIRPFSPSFGRAAALFTCSVLLGSCGDVPVPDPQVEMSRGVESSLRYDFDAALLHFRNVRSVTDSGSVPWLGATLGAAVALHHRVPLNAQRIVAEAVPLYEQVVARGENTQLAARAALSLGRIAEERDDGNDASDSETAIRWYQRVIDGWTSDPIAGEATVRLASCRIQSLESQQVKEGIKLAEARATAYPAEPWAASLWLLAGDAWWIQIHDHTSAIRCLLLAEERGLPDPSMAWSTAWRIATLAEEADMREVAIVHYRKIITEFGSSGKAYEAAMRLVALGETPPSIRPPLELAAAAEAP